MRIEEKEDALDEFLSDIMAEIFWEWFSFVTLKDNMRILSVKSKIAGQIFKDGLVNRNEAREIIQYEKDTSEKWTEYFKSSQPTNQPQDSNQKSNNQ